MGTRRATRRHCSTRHPVLAADPSAELRDRLLTELAIVPSADAMADWAYRSLPAKNTLCVTDAELVETSFRERLAILGEAGSEDRVEATETPGQSHCLDGTRGRNSVRGARRHSVGCTAPRWRRLQPKTIRLRDKDYRRFVSRQPCLVCGRTPADPHHLRFAQPRAMSRKVSDEFTVPVCRLHHRELHRHGDEKLWWKKINIDPLPIALRLWKQGRTNVPASSLLSHHRSRKKARRSAQIIPAALPREGHARDVVSANRSQSA